MALRLEDLNCGAGASISGAKNGSHFPLPRRASKTFDQCDLFVPNEGHNSQLAAGFNARVRRHQSP